MTSTNGYRIIAGAQQLIERVLTPRDCPCQAMLMQMQAVPPLVEDRLCPDL